MKNSKEYAASIFNPEDQPLNTPCRKNLKRYKPKTKTKLNSVALVRKQTKPTERPPLVGEVVPTFADRGCCVVSATDSHGR
jgi:hypothetical protein